MKFYGITYNLILNQIYATLILYYVLKLLHIKLGPDCNFIGMIILISGYLWRTFALQKDTLKPTETSINESDLIGKSLKRISFRGMELTMSHFPLKTQT